MERAEREVLPRLYAPWMEQLLESAIPAETAAACQDCVMCPAAGETTTDRRDDRYYNPQTKCCSYHPALPNFALGLALGDTSNEAAALGASRLAQQLQRGASPLGLRPPAAEQIIYRHAAHATWGQSLSQRCPYYVADEGSCSIWRYRNGACATWFCKHVRGPVGARFWRALGDLLEEVEQMLSLWCVLELDVGDEALSRLMAMQRDPDAHLTAYDFDGVVDEVRQRQLWGRWHGRERDFFRACAEQVARLVWADLIAIGGPRLRARARVVAMAFERLFDTSLPERLRVGAFEVLRMDERRVRLVTYSPLNPLDVPRRLMDLLPCFDGQLTDAAIEAMATQHAVAIDPALVLRLVDFGVLVADDRDGGAR